MPAARITSHSGVFFGPHEAEEFEAWDRVVFVADLFTRISGRVCSVEGLNCFPADLADSRSIFT